jgi:hypothetical protein
MSLLISHFGVTTAYPDDNMPSASTSLQGTPLFCYQDYTSTLFMPPYVLFTLVLYAVVVCLGDTHKLTIITACSHHTSMVKFVHSGQDPKAVSNLQLLCVTIHMFHLNMTID